MADCEQCGKQFPRAATGRPRRFCSARCRVASGRQPIPAEMRNRAAWVRADGKRPIRPDGRPASSTDRGTWSTFSAVQAGAGDGFGVMLGAGLGCYDLDHVSHEEIAAFVATIPERIVFVERSMSGNGAHVFIEALESPGSRRPGVERYTWGRFIRVTGVRI